MTNKQQVLIVEDSSINRILLKKILSEKYTVIESANGQQAIDIIMQEKDNISAILLDLVMPVMDGFEFMEHSKKLLTLYNIPVIVVTQSDYMQAELMSLSLGATDFILKPYKPQIIHKRLENILELKMTAILRNTVEKDTVTGIYNKETFYTKAYEKIAQNPDTKYAIICADIEHFKLVNDIFSMQEGDNLLKAVAGGINSVLDKTTSLAARLLGDIFVICTPHDQNTLSTIISTCETFANTYPLDLKISFKFGVYLVDDPKVSINKMCDRALLAVKSIKDKYNTNLEYYNDRHRQTLIEEQEITARMKSALKDGEFVPFYQPKYNLITGNIVGAEALVRWDHPLEGLIAPAKFIELFEKNGFITALDFYIWECVCKYLKESLDEGIPTFPISVNVSRVDIHNPNTCSYLKSLIEKYDIPPHLLELEITETAYTENADQLICVINEFKSLGFTVEMDDFGSGYSSLNILSDLAVDVLKLDMRFLQSKNAFTNKKNLLNFIVSLAKWIGVSTMAEGVETIEQVSFLRSMGYTKGQGFFFEKPLPENQYKALVIENKPKYVGADNTNIFSQFLSYSQIWDPTSQFNVLFSGFVGALALWEYSFKTGAVTFIRANELMDEIYFVPSDGEPGYSQNPLTYIFASEKSDFLKLVDTVGKTNTSVHSENRWTCSKHPLKEKWISTNINSIFSDPEKAVLLVGMTDITEQKLSEKAAAQTADLLQKERNFFKHIYDSIPCGVAQFYYYDNNIVFKNFNLAMAKMLGYPTKAALSDANLNFYDAVKQEYRERLKIKMAEFSKGNLGYSKDFEYEIIQADGQSIWVLDKSEVAENIGGEKVIQSFFTDITNKQNKIESLHEKASQDPLTHLLNREASEIFIKETLSGIKKFEGAFLILDIDNFKDINDTYGHQMGDEVLKSVAEAIRKTLRSSDIISRIGGDEFIIFLKDLPSEFLAYNLALALCKNISFAIEKQHNIQLGCSIGIAKANNSKNDYITLYKNADYALYEAKQNGKNQCCIFKD